ncbi:Low affinity vacuolar monovalent cation/H(+) antiporter [Podosphaera aphanis]|nr:Low affinity vacuolar monovalent cation/H(+) antiporter [Podosphaera aphanis]
MDLNSATDRDATHETSLKGHNMSDPPSPTSTSVRFSSVEPIAKSSVPSQDVVSESFQSTETMRRWPEPQSSYGSINAPARVTSQPEQRPIEGPRINERLGTYTLDSSRPKKQSTSTTQAQERVRGGQKTKRLGPTRRTSNVQAPHRGQEFSVDDDVTEIQNDLAKGSSHGHSFSSNSARQQPSTLRRRTNAQLAPTLAIVPSSDNEDDTGRETEVVSNSRTEIGEEEASTLAKENPRGSECEDETNNSDALENEDDSVSDAESFTLKDRQQAINETHPFGIRIWKPALYKKDRSVQKNAEGDIHSSPGGRVSRWILFFNILWTVCFGWWLSLVAFFGAAVCFIFAAAPSAQVYGRVLWGLSGYLFYPFGKFVRLEQDEAYAHEDEGEGRSITEYEQWQSGDIEDGRLFFGPQQNRSIVGRSRGSIDSTANENDSLLGRARRSLNREDQDRPLKRRLFGRGQWNTGRVIFFLFFYGLITPLLIIVSGICWFLVFWIPMGKVTLLLFYHLRRHPLALSFQSDSAYSRGPIPNSSILVCSYRAAGLKYWKYTIDGTNIFLINLMFVVLFVIFDYFVLVEIMGFKDLFITHTAFLFTAALFSIIPLAYFIGQAVASISAQSSMGVGAAINAFFSTLVEVFLYCVALNQGKGQLVEGSIIGSIFAGVLFLPGLSMCFGAIKRKTQRFNAKSAGVTSTMLLFAVIAAFGPTLFYQIYGTHELNCISCIVVSDNLVGNRDCRRCYFSQAPSLNDQFYLHAVRPYCWIAATLLFLSYMIGLWFTLRTHAAVIWNEVDEKKPPHDNQNIPGHHSQRQNGDARPSEIRDSLLYKRILGQSLTQLGTRIREEGTRKNSLNDYNSLNINPRTTHQPPPKIQGNDSSTAEIHIPGLTDAQSTSLVREVAEIAAAAATIAAGNVRKIAKAPSTTHASSISHKTLRTGVVHDTEESGPAGGHSENGHVAPNWSRTKSSIVLCLATVLYALIAEILVGTVDVVLKNVSIDEKFLGITLFALVPNTTEFLNAISFAMNGNIALSMEIGSAYALQVCLLQIPALVLYSALNGQNLLGPNAIDHIFSLIFPQWDMVTVILCVFLLSYMYGEGKSNYFKGSILLLSYLVVISGFWFSGMTDLENMSVHRFDSIMH